MVKKIIEIRIDDVFLLNNLTNSMKNSLRKYTFFEHFKLMDKILETLKEPVILTILAEGIQDYPEWVEYIKARQKRFVIELHGYSHYYYQGMTEEQAYQSLALAKYMIEEAFGVKVSRWYVPFGRHYFPEWSFRVCDRLGLKFHTKGGVTRHFYYHYWNSRDRLRLERLIEQHPQILK